MISSFPCLGRLPATCEWIGFLRSLPGFLPPFNMVTVVEYSRVWLKNISNKINITQDYQQTSIIITFSSKASSKALFLKAFSVRNYCVVHVYYKKTTVCPQEPEPPFCEQKTPCNPPLFVSLQVTTVDMFCCLTISTNTRKPSRFDNKSATICVLKSQGTTEHCSCRT